MDMKDFNSKRSNAEKEGYRDANILIDSTKKYQTRLLL